MKLLENALIGACDLISRVTCAVLSAVCGTEGEDHSDEED